MSGYAPTAAEVFLAAFEDRVERLQDLKVVQDVGKYIVRAVLVAR